MFIRVTDKFETASLLNMAMFALIAKHPEGGSRLFPRSPNERYDGPATLVREGLDTFEGVPGFVAVTSQHYEVGGPMLVNMARVTRVEDLGNRRRIHFLDSTSNVDVPETTDEIRTRLLKASPYPATPL